MKFFKSLGRKTLKKADVSDVSRQILDLRSMLISVIQDIYVLKAMLKEKGLWDEARYKKLRIQRMIDDHSSAGCDSEKNTSYYPHSLSEADFLGHEFQASEVEVQRFETQ